MAHHGHSRRDILSWSGALALGAALSRSTRSGTMRAAGAQLAWASAPARSSSTGVDLEDTLRWVMTTPRDPALRRAARELHAGMDAGQLLGAILVAASRDIRTDRPTINHSVLSVSAIDQLTHGADASDRERDAMWCLDYFKEVQEVEAAHEDWRMAPLEAAKLPSGDKARAALIDAFEKWDRDAADIAVTGWVRSASLDEVWAIVWKYALRCGRFSGHKAIHAVLSRRALPLAGDRYAEDVLRSVVAMLLAHGPSRFAEAFEVSRELVENGLSAKKVADVQDRGAALEMLAELRRSDGAELPAKTAELIRGGASQAALWDAIVVAACEVAVADIGVGPLHALTSTNSMHFIARHAPNARVAMLALLQAAAWAADFHRGLAPELAAVRIDALEPKETTLEALLVDGRRTLSTASGAIWLANAEPDRFADQLRSIAHARSDDVHEFKLAAAALEESRAVGAWARPFTCAALSVYAPSPARADGDKPRRIRDARAIASKR